MSESIPKIIPKVICLGEILIDRITAQISNQISNQEGDRSEISEVTTPYHGGAPANVACGLAKLGTPSAFIGCIGRDPSGVELLQMLKNNGVDTSGVQIHLTAPTRQVCVTHSEDGDRHFTGFVGTGFVGTGFVEAGFADSEVNTAFADTLLLAAELPVKLFEDAEFLVLGTLGLASEVTARAINRALDLAEENFVKIIVDVNWRSIFWSNGDLAPKLINDLLLRADFVKFSAEEAEWLYETSSPRAIAQELDHLEGVIVTNGGQSCRYYLGEYSGTQPAFKVKVVDTTGAGDGFLAGFIHQLCQSLDNFSDPQVRSDIISYASAVGAITVMGMGAIAPQPDDLQVQNFLTKQEFSVDNL